MTKKRLPEQGIRRLRRKAVHKDLSIYDRKKHKQDSQKEVNNNIHEQPSKDKQTEVIPNETDDKEKG